MKFNQTTHWRVALSMVLGLLALAGCRAEIPGRPKLVKVTGSVSFKGQPLEEATVVFIPQGHPHAATGRTDAQGDFQLQTYEPGDGAAAGSYQVTVKKFYFVGDVEHQLLPDRYAKPAESGFKVDVEPEGDNYFDFELKE